MMKLPKVWQERLEAYLKSQGKKRKRLLWVDFPDGIAVLTHDDGTVLVWRHAIILWNEDQSECCVFTEHCGYHVFQGMEPA